MPNRYIPKSRLSDRQVEELIQAVALFFPVALASKLAKVSERTAAATMRTLRMRLCANRELLSEAGLGADWPPSNSSYWADLYACVYECPREIRDPVRFLGNEITLYRGNRRECVECPFEDMLGKRGNLLHSLRWVKTAQRGIPLKEFKYVFLIAMMKERYLHRELIKNPPASYEGASFVDQDPDRIMVEAFKQALIIRK